MSTISLVDETVTLCARDLFCKHGFKDGDLIDEVFWDDQRLFDINFNDRNVDMSLCHAVLIALVETYLMPLLPATAKANRYQTIHNPILIDDDEDLEKTVENISFTLTFKQVRDLALKLVNEARVIDGVKYYLETK